jgi:hypothetical protein
MKKKNEVVISRKKANIFFCKIMHIAIRDSWSYNNMKCNNIINRNQFNN